MAAININKIVTVVCVLIFGCTVRTYAAEIKNAEYDTFGRASVRIDENSPRKEYQKGQSELYTGLEGIFDGIYFNNANSSRLSGGDFAEITDYRGKRCLHLHSGIYNENGNKYIELYKAPEKKLDSSFNFVYETDILFADNVCGINFAIKAGGKWRNVEFSVPKGSRILDSRGDKISMSINEWHHLAFVLHKESACFSLYIDGAPLFERKALSPAPSPAVKPGTFSSVTLKMAKSSSTSDIYIDNVCWYEQYGEYDGQKSYTGFSSERYTVENGEIYGVPEMKAEDFVKDITVHDGAAVQVLEQDGKSAVRGENRVYDGMYLEVTSADGRLAKQYKIHGRDKIGFYDENGSKIDFAEGSGTITVKADSRYETDGLIAAAYDESGKLMGVKTLSGGECSFDTESCIKVYSWQNMKPIEKESVLRYSKHPFMLLDKEDFEELRKKMSQQPWKDIAENAITKMRTKTGTWSVDGSERWYPARCNEISGTISAAALCYILYPELREESRGIILNLIDYWNPDHGGNIYNWLYPSKGDYFSRCVPPSTTFVHCIIALDIIHDDITAEQLAEAEKVLKPAAERFISTDEGHMPAVLGARGMWGIYTGNEELVNTAWNDWLKWYNGYMSESGAASMGVEYALVRFISSERLSKGILPSVMEHTGRTEGFFAKNKNAGFIEWAIGYSYSPSRLSWAIGDTSVRRKVKSDTVTAFRLGDFSKTAAEYRAFILNGNTEGTLINYLTAENADAKAPESRIFKDGGAWFYENAADEMSLGGFLFNTTATDGHAHKETNSVNVAAYGEVLTINAGYNKWNTGAGNYSWNYINNRAVSANTVLVDYDYGDIYNPSSVNDHQRKNGGGISAGLITDKLAYACGDSGNALPNAVHKRGFIMVEPKGAVPGYFILADSVSGGEKMTVVHRPFSEQYTANKENEEYCWTVNRNSGNDVGLSVYLASKPDAVKIEDGGAAVWEDSIPIKTLMADYSSDNRALSVLYPYNTEHEKAEMTRIEGTAQGAVIKSGNTADYLIQNGNYAESGAEYSGSLVLVRKTNGILDWFFAEAATEFSCDGKQYFKSDGEVTLVMDRSEEESFKAYAKYDTVITVNVQNASGVTVNGKKVMSWNDGNGISFMLASGENEINISVF